MMLEFDRAQRETTLCGIQKVVRCSRLRLGLCSLQGKVAGVLPGF